MRERITRLSHAGRALRRFRRGFACVIGLFALLTGLTVTGVAQAAHRPAAVGGDTSLASVNPGVQNDLYGVKALSNTDAWAVGYYCTSRCATNPVDRTLIVHWNGTAWSRVTSPNPSTNNDLSSVAAVSSSSVWAVGSYCTSSCDSGSRVDRTLIVHWNGTAWSQISSPDTVDGKLTAVTATSPSNVWAVGYSCTPGCYSASLVAQTLIEHWNGTVWSVVTSPHPSTQEDILLGVSATGANDAWAAGIYCASNCGTSSRVFRNLIVRWNGASWSQVASPSPSSTTPILQGISADSPTDGWAAGYFNTRSASKTMLLRWNGSSWSKVNGPSPGSASVLQGVTALSSSDAWAVGQYFQVTRGRFATLILHWNGMAWSKVKAPSPSQTSNVLYAFDADSATDAWAVGNYCSSNCASNSETDRTLILRWNGTSWSKS